MSPIKPSMLTLHPRKPQPRALRRINCPSCGHCFDVSSRAMSMRCPKCTRPFKLEDVTVSEERVGELDTMGHVHLTANSTMSGNLACGQLTIDGRYDGEAEVHGQLELHKGASLTGQITARSLLIDEGATVQANVRIGQPQQNASPPSQSSTSVSGRSRSASKPAPATPV